MIHLLVTVLVLVAGAPPLQPSSRSSTCAGTPVGQVCLPIGRDVP